MDPSPSANLTAGILFSVDNLDDTDHALSLTVQTDVPEALFEFDSAEISGSESTCAYLLLWLESDPHYELLKFKFYGTDIKRHFFLYRKMVLSQRLGHIPSVHNCRGQCFNSIHRSVKDRELALTHLTLESRDSSPTSRIHLPASWKVRYRNPRLKRLLTFISYSVTLDNVTTSFSARSSFSQANSLLFFASGLDAQATHKLEIINTEGATLVLPVGGTSVWALSETFVVP